MFYPFFRTRIKPKYIYLLKKNSNISSIYVTILRYIFLWRNLGIKKGLVLFVSFLILMTMSIVSCGDDDDGGDGDGAIQEYGEPSFELGRYTSECKTSNKAGRSEKTIIDIAANHIIITNYRYKYTGALSCEEANNVYVLELSYQYKKQSIFKGADLINLELKRAILTPKTEEEADAYNEEEKYDSTYWEADHGELITEEYMEESAKENRNITKMLVKTSKNFLYVLPFTEGIIHTKKHKIL